MRHPRSPAALAPTLVLVLAVVLGACTAPESPSPEPEQSAAGTPLPAYDLSGVALARSPYCDRISAPGVVAALDGTAADADTWHNGERVDVGGGRDVAHEYGCRYTREGATAEAWLFAPPVTPRRAAALAREARTTRGCEDARSTATFGRPSVALLCSTQDGTTASYRGLFGDAWLVCGLARDGLERAELVDLAGRWCVEVVAAARAG